MCILDLQLLMDLTILKNIPVLCKLISKAVFVLGPSHKVDFNGCKMSKAD